MKESAHQQPGDFTEKLFVPAPVIKYGSRVLTLYIFSLIFKSFDLSFIGDMAVIGSVRSNVFSLLFVAYGLLVWSGAIWVIRIAEQHIGRQKSSVRLAILCLVLLLYGGFVAFGFGFIYAVSDILLFNRYEAWNSFIQASYNMLFGIFMFYMFLVAFNGIIFYYKEWKEYQIATERLSKENIQAKYDALRNQIDPHFFFNSLSVLTNLVYKNPDLSAEYITQLAKTYRYILDRKFENLVTIQTELDFLDSYLFLIKIRHQNSIQVELSIDEATKATGMIPPAALQMLVENAIKHNRFSVDKPLHISIKNENNRLIVSNTLNRKPQPDISSSGIGLENISKRYELTNSGPVDIFKTESVFSVSIPVIYK